MTVEYIDTDQALRREAAMYRGLVMPDEKYRDLVDKLATTLYSWSGGESVDACRARVQDFVFALAMEPLQQDEDMDPIVMFRMLVRSARLERTAKMLEAELLDMQNPNNDRDEEAK